MSGAHKPNVKAYLAVFAALMVLTVVTVSVSYWHLPPAPAIALGLAIATLKAGLVAAFFMHLKGERLLIYGLLGITVFFMAVLFTLPTWDSWDIREMTQRVEVAAPHQAAAAHH
ncbi:MAG: cytochrome C oxidase subunit IV family protein [Elusimicrobia bacterium]|nr:cytochrome C oxidase subunit IV family protein [Elusimicrobiota bacterium]